MYTTIEALKAELTPLHVEKCYTPVIVKTEYKKNKFTLGVQFWNEFLINQGFARNPDGTVAKFIEEVRS
jgi:hypothetical protein